MNEHLKLMRNLCTFLDSSGSQWAVWGREMDWRISVGDRKHPMDRSPPPSLNTNSLSCNAAACTFKRDACTCASVTLPLYNLSTCQAAETLIAFQVFQVYPFMSVFYYQTIYQKLE